MASHLTGVVVAILIVFGLYASLEMAAGNPIFSQDKLDAHSVEQLYKLARDFGSEHQVEAILQLGQRPGDLSVTVPLLAKLAASPAELVKNAADSWLETIGAPAAGHLRPILDAESYAIACSAMRAIGPECKMYLPEIKRLLEDEKRMNRKCGLYALQGMGEHGKEAMDEIIVCVLDEDLNNQCSACRVLEKFGPDAIDAEKALLQLLEKGGPSTRGWAAVCLGAIGPTSSDVDVAKLLAEKLNSKRTFNPVEQQRLLAGLAYLGPDALKVADSVRAKMAGKNKFVRGHAAYALWRITGEADESLKVISALIDHPEHTDDGLEIAGKMGPAGLPLLDQVVRRLSANEPGTRELAVVAIGNMGPGAKSAEPKLVERLADSDALVRLAARRTLAEIRVEPAKQGGGEKAPAAKDETSR
jgi:HEAT repeat protein